MTPLLLVLATVAQADRRQQVKTPGLVLEAGGPAAATRAMTFTADGRHLLAAGQYKAVYSWPVADGLLDTTARTTLRWRAWHEWRGSIYAMALSPDEKLVAVAGDGAVPAELAVIDRATGKVVAGWIPAAKYDGVNWSLAFSPDGKELAVGTDHGEVLVWPFRQKPAAVREVGTHGPRGGSRVNRVHHVGYRGPNEVLSVTQDGHGLAWNTAAPGPAVGVFRSVVPNLYRTAATPDGRLIALGGQDDQVANRVEVRPTAGGEPLTLQLPADSIPTAVGLSRDGRQLAVGVQYRPPGGVFHKPWTFQVWVCDVTAAGIACRTVADISYAADAFAFGPAGDTLAVAGGEDYAVKLLALNPLAVKQTVASAGRPIWGVALSADGSKVGFRTARNPDPAGFNDWAAGSWTSFDLTRRAAPGEDAGFRPVAPVETLDGWRVEAVQRRRWQVVRGDTRHELPLDPDRHVRPTCFTFLNPPGGGTRLAVGHLWGFSVFALTDAGAKLVQVGYGHAGELTSIAPSADHTRVVTASRDQTVCCFGLSPWPQHGELGATFAAGGGRLAVAAPAAPGSPAGEAGLSAGDEVLVLKLANVPVAPGRWAAVLADPPPNQELYQEVRRPGVEPPVPVPLKTTVRRRPVWKLFPMADGEWVLWRWQDHYYDSSAGGDAAVGWQVNGDDPAETPAFYKAEQFRRSRRRPDLVTNAVAARFPGPNADKVVDHLPPGVELAIEGDAADGRGVTARLRVVSAPDGSALQPESVSLWVNDHKFRAWPGRAGFAETVAVPAELFRRGRPNRLVAHTYTAEASPTRGESHVRRVDGPPPAGKPKLHGLFVGVNDYSKAPRMGTKFWPNLLCAVDDAVKLEEAWRAVQKAGQFDAGKVFMLTMSAEVTRDNILDRLKQIHAASAADDLVVVFLAGHGWAPDGGRAAGRFGADGFAYVTPHFELANYRTTGLPSEDLYDALTALPARKLVLLDTCHSGSVVGAEYVRGLTPEGVGPPILASAGREEEAIEFLNPLGHGLFTWAVLDGMGANFRLADINGDGRLSVRELADFVTARVPAKLAELKRRMAPRDQSLTQRPQLYPTAAHDDVEVKSVVVGRTR